MESGGVSEADGAGVQVRQRWVRWRGLSDLVRPSLGFGLALLVFWFWRVLALLALGKWGYRFAVSDGVAFVWDVLLVGGWFSLARMAGPSRGRGVLLTGFGVGTGGRAARAWGGCRLLRAERGAF